MSKFMSAKAGAKDEPPVARGLSVQPACFILSDHPLAFYTIKNALSSDPSLINSVKSHSASCKPSAKSDILILDACSVEGWPDVLEKWHSAGGRSVVLMSEVQSADDELQMLYLGAAGILVFSQNLSAKLPTIVWAVAQGELWVRRDVLGEYVRHTNLLWRNMSSPDRFFTAREQEIIEFLRRGYSNKQIASALGISERTAKFHVSNILSKCEVDSRKNLLEAGDKALKASNALGLVKQGSPRCSLVSKHGAVADTKRTVAG